MTFIELYTSVPVLMALTHFQSNRRERRRKSLWEIERENVKDGDTERHTHTQIVCVWERKRDSDWDGLMIQAFYLHGHWVRGGIQNVIRNTKQLGKWLGKFRIKLIFSHWADQQQIRIKFKRWQMKQTAPCWMLKHKPTGTWLSSRCWITAPMYSNS